MKNRDYYAENQIFESFWSRSKGIQRIAELRFESVWTEWAKFCHLGDFLGLKFRHNLGQYFVKGCIPDILSCKSISKQQKMTLKF